MKSLRLRVKSDGNVYVSAPYGVPTSVIDEFVSSRAEWIEEQRQKIQENPIKTELNDGDTIILFGKECVVCTQEGSGEPHIAGSKLVVPTAGGELESAVIRYMALECSKICSEAVSEYLKKAGYKGPPVQIAFKYMKSKWGSCNRKTNTITFNLALCKLSEHFIKYVAAHEVTHFFVPNHSKDFYSFGEGIFDGFFKTDRELNKIKISSIFQ